MHADTLLSLCCVVVVGIPIALVIWSVILRSACHFVGVCVPEVARGMRIMFVAGLVNGIVGFGISLVVGVVWGEDPTRAVGRPSSVNRESFQAAQLLSAALSLPIQALLSARIYSLMLDDCSFGRGFLVWLVQILIGLFIAAFIMGIVIAVSVLAASTM